LRQAQFHWGKPPPAAEPRILMCISRHDHNGNAVARATSEKAEAIGKENAGKMPAL
jgi:hypothetical protein